MQLDTVHGPLDGLPLPPGLAGLFVPPPVPVAPLDVGFRAIDVEWAAEDRVLWCHMNTQEPPHFTPALLRELIGLGFALRRSIETPRSPEMAPRYFVLGSRTPGMFNLGGDLALFVAAIRAGDRDRLRAYAYDCVECTHLSIGAGLPLTSIALVQGDALGGGFEAALSFDVVIAERSAKLGLPEILFNLFPGMGAYSLLSRRMDAVRAERMILSGRLYGAEELNAMGLVDIVAEDGCGAIAAQDYIAASRRSYVTRQTLFGIRKTLNPISLQELRDITDRWVDAAFSLCEQDLRRMEQLTAAQRRRRRSAIQGVSAV